MNVGQISFQNKGDMMKIEMKHHPGVTVLQNSEELFPTEVHGQNLAQFSGNSVTDSYAPLVSKQERTLTDFVFQVMAWVPLHLIKIFKLTKIKGVEHKVIK